MPNSGFGGLGLLSIRKLHRWLRLSRPGAGFDELIRRLWEVSDRFLVAGRLAGAQS